MPLLLQDCIFPELPAFNPLGPDFPLTHARIGYQNVLLDGGVSAAVGDPFNILTPSTWDRWNCGANNTLIGVLNTPTPVDYLAVAAHNLGSTDATIAVVL